MIKLLAFVLPLVAVAASAGDLDQYYEPSDRPRWYVAPEEGPLVGTQNFWYVTPHDVDPGGFTMSGSPTDVTGDAFTIRPNSVWGHYTYRVTRLGDEASTDNQPHDRKVISSRELLFSQLGDAQDRTLLIHGTITEVIPDSQGFNAHVTFAGGSLPLRFEVVKIENEKPLPDVHSRRYGPHWHQTFDVYYPQDRSKGPFPILMNIHGGGWRALDKGPYQSGRWTNAGIAVVSINYRFTNEADEHPAVVVPVAAPLLDAARALQFIRYHAEELNLDTQRICVSGGSAGGASSCWLAMHDDLAEPDGDDLVARMSTRVACASPHQAQTSLDPKQMRAWIPSITYGAHAFFPNDQLPRDKAAAFELFLEKRQKLLPYIREFSPFEHASADDPPMLHVYGGQEDVIPATNQGNATHHPKFGEMLHGRLSELGVESHFWADNVDAKNPRYNGWPGVHLFITDKLLGGESPTQP